MNYIIFYCQYFGNKCVTTNYFTILINENLNVLEIVL